METLKDNKATILTAIIVALATFALTNFFGNMNKLKDTLTQEQVTEQIEESGEDILSRSMRYTDDRVNATKENYQMTLKNIEKLMKANDDRLAAILTQINDRLDRIDKRIPK
jgi:type II secretory pathway pseudopilin PulG